MKISTATVVHYQYTEEWSVPVTYWDNKVNQNTSISLWFYAVHGKYALSDMLSIYSGDISHIDYQQKQLAKCDGSYLVTSKANRDTFTDMVIVSNRGRAPILLHTQLLWKDDYKHGLYECCFCFMRVIVWNNYSYKQIISGMRCHLIGKHVSDNITIVVASCLRILKWIVSHFVKIFPLH